MTKTLEERIAKMKSISEKGVCLDYFYGEDIRDLAKQAMSIISELQQLLHLKEKDLAAAQGIIVEMKGENEWRPIEDDSCPLHLEVLFYREDAGVFLGKLSYLYDWLVNENSPNLNEFSEQELWDLDYWYISDRGADRIEADLKPTHWRPLPQPPKLNK